MQGKQQVHQKIYLYIKNDFSYVILECCVRIMHRIYSLDISKTNRSNVDDPYHRFYKNIDIRSLTKIKLRKYSDNLVLK